MVGVRAGGASRDALRTIMDDVRGTPLYQLLDDFAGASLVAGWIWFEWGDGRPTTTKPSGVQSTAGRGGNMVNICTGFAEGAASLVNGTMPDLEAQSRTEVPPLENPEDPAGWHTMPEQRGRPLMRRARRLDLYRDNDLLHADVGFQDSGSNRRGTRTAVHEYRVHAEIDPASMVLISVQALPLVLPYRECPGAAVKVGRMIGKSVADFREDVLDELSGTLGCTHLNDVLRSLADVPVLASVLP